MDLPNLVALTALAAVLLAIHVYGAILVLRTARLAGHHMARLEELLELENGILARSLPRGASEKDAETPKEAEMTSDSASQALHNLFGQTGRA